MYLNIDSGRMRHHVSLIEAGGGSDDYGDPLPSVLVFEAYAEVQVKSGNQLVDYGTALTSEIITVLMWYDPRAKNSQKLVWEGITYDIQHIKPDTQRRGMIITCKVERNE